MYVCINIYIYLPPNGNWLMARTQMPHYTIELVRIDGMRGRRSGLIMRVRACNFSNKRQLPSVNRHLWSGSEIAKDDCTASAAAYSPLPDQRWSSKGKPQSASWRGQTNSRQRAGGTVNRKTISAQDTLDPFPTAMTNFPKIRKTYKIPRYIYIYIPIYLCGDRLQHLPLKP